MYMIALRGERAAEEALFEALAERFRLFAEQRIEDRAAREDVVQESLATIAEKYRVTEFSSSFAAWVYGVLQKKIQRYYRAKGYYNDRYEDSPAQAVSLPDPGLHIALSACLKELCRRSTSQARVLNLAFQGYTVSEICARLKITPNACYVQLSRARAHIRDCLRRKKASL